MTVPARPADATAALVLADGGVFWGKGIGAEGVRIGEVCFNTSMTGYQEIMTDPSYAGQIVTFTFPHIGNVGAIDTRRLTRRVRDGGAPSGALCHAKDAIDIADLRHQARAWPGLEGMDLAKEVSCRQLYRWDETAWVLGQGYGKLEKPRYRVVAVDYGAKR